MYIKNNYLKNYCYDKKNTLNWELSFFYKNKKREIKSKKERLKAKKRNKSKKEKSNC